MQKGFTALPILSGILIIGGLISSYLYFNKSTPSSNVNTAEQKDALKTYSNEKLGFQLQYTNKDFMLQEDTEEEFNTRGNGNFRKNFAYYITYEPAKFIGAALILDKTQSFDNNPFTVWVFENPNNLTIDKWYQLYWYYPFVWGDYTGRRNNVAPIKEATISGQMAKYGIVNYQPADPKFIYLSNKQKIYLFRLIGSIGDQILATFKLLQ